MKYHCRNCGSTFEPGNKKENVEIYPQSWSCPMCGICDWDNKPNVVKKNSIALQKVKSFIYEQQGRFLELIGNSKKLYMLSKELEPFLKKMETSLDNYIFSLYEECQDFQKILDKLE
jgi:rubredoxin